MSEVDKGYELKVLKIIINKYLDETVSDTSEGLQSLEVNCDQIVWELATKIYSQSGHKVEFSIVRDVIDSRIRTIEAELEVVHQVVEENAHRVAEEKVRRAAEVARWTAAEEARLRDQMTPVLERLGGDEAKVKVFVKVRAIVSEQLGVGESAVDLGSRFYELGADSLNAVALMMALEEEFDIEIPDEEAEEASEVKEVVDLIYGKLSA